MADFKPSDLFVGIVDFFAVLLPGAVLTFALQVNPLRDCINDLLLKDHSPGATWIDILLKDRSPHAKWIIFIIASYLFGHFIFLIGARFLDDLYNATYAKRQGIKGHWRLIKHVEKIKGEALQGARRIENSFKWARAYVKLNKPEASVDIDRLEADSKFFRSLVVVAVGAWILTGIHKLAWGALLLTAGLVLTWFARNYRPRKTWKITRLERGLLQKAKVKNQRNAFLEQRLWQKTYPRFLPWRRMFNRWRVFILTQYLLTGLLILGAVRSHSNWWPVIGCFVVMCLSAWRYADQRWKMTQVAYLYFSMLNQPAKK